jgi:hypothetical protein
MMTSSIGWALLEHVVVFETWIHLQSADPVNFMFAAMLLAVVAGLAVTIIAARQVVLALDLSAITPLRVNTIKARYDRPVALKDIPRPVGGCGPRAPDVASCGSLDFIHRSTL